MGTGTGMATAPSLALDPSWRGATRCPLSQTQLAPGTGRLYLAPSRHSHIFPPATVPSHRQPPSTPLSGGPPHSLPSGGTPGLAVSPLWGGVTGFPLACQHPDPEQLGGLHLHQHPGTGPGLIDGGSGAGPAGGGPSLGGSHWEHGRGTPPRPPPATKVPWYPSSSRMWRGVGLPRGSCVPCWVGGVSGGVSSGWACPGGPHSWVVGWHLGHSGDTWGQLTPPPSPYRHGRQPASTAASHTRVPLCGTETGAHACAGLFTRVCVHGERGRTVVPPWDETGGAGVLEGWQWWGTRPRGGIWWWGVWGVWRGGMAAAERERGDRGGGGTSRRVTSRHASSRRVTHKGPGGCVGERGASAGSWRPCARRPGGAGVPPTPFPSPLGGSSHSRDPQHNPNLSALSPPQPWCLVGRQQTPK